MHSALKIGKIMQDFVFKCLALRQSVLCDFSPQIGIFSGFYITVAMTEEEIQAKKDAHKDHIAAVEKFSKSLPFCWEAAA